MSEGNPDKTREDGPAPTEIGEASVRLEKPVPAQEVSESRRRFAKAGLIASPILMSVVSRPVIGGGFNCLSNALSGNMSNPDRGFCAIPADNNVDWTNATNWPGAPLSWPKVMGCGIDDVPVMPDLNKKDELPLSCEDQNFPCNKTNSWDCSGGTRFSDIFCGVDDRSMYQILCLYAGNTDELGLEDKAAAIEMLLYSLKEESYALRPMQVQDLYAGRPGGGGDGTYTAFLSHYCGTLKGYLNHTLGLPLPCA